MLNILPKRKPITRIRTADTKAASFNEYLSRIKRTLKLARPSLMPGIPAKTGISVST